MNSLRIAIVAAALAAATVVPDTTIAAPAFHVGQTCKPSRQKAYMAKGFTCVKKHGKWRLKRQSMTF